MVLFYSSDGQLFLIKPSTVIDSETRFSLQYLNKSANDFLANYDVYINERLSQYGRPERINKEDVQITTSVSINYLKIYYSVPGVITMILYLDVLNNRFFFYDTLSFTNIYDKMFIDGGEVLFTRTNNLTLFTRNHKDNYDMNLLTDFRKDPVCCLLDTGNINLNNHLRKRFRDLRVTFKNINAERVNYTLETWVDSVVVKPAYDNVLKVSNLDGRSTYVEELDDTAVDMINKDKLLDF